MPEVTYGRLDTVLRALGFVYSEPEPGTKVYRHLQTGALVTFPVLPVNKTVLPHHLEGTRMILDAFGIAEPPEFTARLQAS